MSKSVTQTAEIVDLSQRRKIDAKTKLEISEKVDGWLGAITGSEAKLLRWLLRVTLHWNSWSGDFSDPQILGGIPKARIPGVGLSERTLHRVKRSLERRGLLCVGIAEGWGRKTRYRINFDWTPEQGGNSGNLAPTPCQNGTLDGAKMAPHKSIVPKSITYNLSSGETLAVRHRSREGFLRFKKEEGQGRKDRDLAGRDREAAPTSEERPSDRETEPLLVKTEKRRSLDVIRTLRPRVEKSNASSDHIGELRAVWEKAWAETYSADADGVPTGRAVCPPWTKREIGTLTGFVSTFGDRKRLPEFIDFAVRRWRKVLFTKCAWIKKVPRPDFPTIGFMVWRWNEFLDAWASQDVATWLDVQPHEKRKLEKLRVKGFTTEAARLEIATDRLVSIDRKKRAEDIEHAQLYRRMGDRARQEAERIARHGLVVKHPQSWMNQPPPKVEVTEEKTSAEWVPPVMTPFEEGGG